MLPYTEFNKPRLLFDTFYLIKSGQATTKKELAEIFETSEKTIYNYIEELNSDFQTLISFDESKGRYIIEHEGTMGLLKRNYPITADDVLIIISSLLQSQAFMETKMSIIKNSLLGLLPEEDGKKLKNMLHFEKSKNYNNQIIEFNVTKIRKAITEEKKITFSYTNYEETRKTFKVVPYSFACDMGKYYIICKPEDKDSLTHLRIDRMGNVQILAEEGKREETFNIYNYLKRTWYMFGGPETIVLVRFKKECKKIIVERNMVEGRIIDENENYFIYEFNCNGTVGIKLWLLGFGGDAEVLEPVEFRREMKLTIENMTKVYAK